MPCPMCLLGYPEPHTKEDWARVMGDPDERERLHAIVEARRKEVEKAYGGEIPEGLCF